MEADEKYIWIQDDEYEYLPGKKSFLIYLIKSTNNFPSVNKTQLKYIKLN